MRILTSVLWLCATNALIVAASEKVLTQPCLLIKTMFRDQKPIWKCVVDPVDYEGRSDHRLPIIGLTENEFEEAVSGSTYMIANGAIITDKAIDPSGVSDWGFQIAKSAVTSARVTGDRKVLAVRIISNDGATPYSQATVKDNVFTDAVNLIERFRACSYNKLRFSAYSGMLNGNTITDGVYDLVISQNTNGAVAYDIADSMISELTQALGNSVKDDVDYIMFFMPSNVGRFGGFADFVGQFSWYDGFNAGVESVTLVHEIGHNLGLDHSAEGDEEYGDGMSFYGVALSFVPHTALVVDTCSMGFGLSIDDFAVCFNPAKSWALQWYADKQTTQDLSFAGVREYSLVGVADYENAGNNNLIVKLANSGGDDYFIGFNRAVGINADQVEAVNQVTVVRSAGDDEISYLMAKLSEGEAYTIGNVEIFVESIDLNASPSVATISITGDEIQEEEEEEEEQGGGGGGEGNGVGGGGPSCFSGNNQVLVLGKGDILMENLEIGDYVQVGGNDDFSRVYGFLHLQRNLLAEYLLVRFEQGRPLEISSKHLLFSKGRTVAAGDLTIGDHVEGAHGKSLKISAIEIIQRQGVFAPATESGDIVVSNVRASNYVNLLANSVIEHHTMSHAFMLPIRLFCRFDFGHCQEQTYTEEGYSHWVKFFIWVSEVLNRWGPILQYGTTLLVSPLIAALSAVNGLLFLDANLLVAGVAIAAGAVGISRHT